VSCGGRLKSSSVLHRQHNLQSSSGQVKLTSQATGMNLVQVQQQLEAQQAQHAAQMEDMSSKAAQMESLIRQATELDLQHVTELNAREADLDELRQVDLVHVPVSSVCVCVCVLSTSASKPELNELRLSEAGVCPVSNLLSTSASSTLKARIESAEIR